MQPKSGEWTWRQKWHHYCALILYIQSKERRNYGILDRKTRNAMRDRERERDSYIYSHCSWQLTRWSLYKTCEGCNAGFVQNTQERFRARFEDIYTHTHHTSCRMSGTRLSEERVTATNGCLMAFGPSVDQYFLGVDYCLVPEHTVTCSRHLRSFSNLVPAIRCVDRRKSCC